MLTDEQIQTIADMYLEYEGNSYLCMAQKQAHGNAALYKYAIREALELNDKQNNIDPAIKLWVDKIAKVVESEPCPECEKKYGIVVRIQQSSMDVRLKSGSPSIPDGDYEFSFNVKKQEPTRYKCSEM